MRQLTVAVLVVAATLGGCAQTDPASTPEVPGGTTPASPTSRDSPTAPPRSPTASGDSARTGTVLKTDSSDFGTMLFDRSGQAIYLFDRETRNRPRCYGPCATAWPPVLTEGLPRGTGDVRTGLLGTTRREDGSTQVTYAEHPLYYYAHEGKKEVLCHDVSEFGGLWLVVTPSGDPAA